MWDELRELPDQMEPLDPDIALVSGCVFGLLSRLNGHVFSSRVRVIGYDDAIGAHQNFVDLEIQKNSGTILTIRVTVDYPGYQRKVVNSGLTEDGLTGLREHLRSLGQ